MEAVQSLRIPLDDAALAALVDAAGVPVGPLSPARDLGERAQESSVSAHDQLLAAGLLQPDGSGVSDVALELLARIVAPQVRIGAAAGTPDWYASTISLGARDVSVDEPLVSMVRDEEGWLIGWPQSVGELIDMFQDHFDGPPVGAEVPLDVVVSPREHAALLGILDHLLHRRLQAILDRESAGDVSFGPEDIWQQLVEGRTSAHLAWQVAVGAVLFPDAELGLGADEVERALSGLAEHELVADTEDGRFVPTSIMLDLVERLIPVARFASVRIDRLRGTSIVATTHVGVRAGLGAILLDEPDGSGGMRVRSVSSLELEDLLLNVWYQERAEAPGTEPARRAGPGSCHVCGASVRPGAAYCTACGSAIERP